jgi:hypothetical protein
LGRLTRLERFRERRDRVVALVVDMDDARLAERAALSIIELAQRAA